MESFVVLGHTPGLSLAELASTLGPGAKLGAAGTEAAIVSVDASSIFPKLGGAVKVGTVEPGSWPNLVAAIDSITPEMFSALPGTGKVSFGFSAYEAGGTMAPDTGHLLKNNGLDVKRRVKGDRSIRFVNRGERNLSSVSVDKNHLIDEGIEFIFMATPSGWRRGRTVAVQDFEAFGARDFGRPQRDMQLGMLPPKLARAMVNLTGSANTVLDPFCGIGTVVQEGVLSGRSTFGSDVAAPVVAKARENMEWLEARDASIHERWQIRTGDARNLERIWSDKKFPAVVTEPFLGPQVTGELSPEKLAAIISQVAGILLSAIPSISAVLEPGGVLVIALPTWRVGRKLMPLEILPAFERAGFRPDPLLPPDIRLPNPFGPTRRGSILYERPQQKVLREIFRYRKK
jgi:tRNA G10  N-methylase Trm11